MNSVLLTLALLCRIDTTYSPIREYEVVHIDKDPGWGNMSRIWIDNHTYMQALSADIYKLGGPVVGEKSPFDCRLFKRGRR